jgi:hypothetical protein
MISLVTAFDGGPSGATDFGALDGSLSGALGGCRRHLGRAGPAGAGGREQRGGHGEHHQVAKLRAPRKARFMAAPLAKRRRLQAGTIGGMKPFSTSIFEQQRRRRGRDRTQPLSAPHTPLNVSISRSRRGSTVARPAACRDVDAADQPRRPSGRAGTPSPG